MIESTFTIADRKTEYVSMDSLPPYYRKLLAEDPKRQAHTAEENGQRTLKEQMDAFERNVIANELLRQKDNITAAARTLGISRQALQYKISKYGLHA